MKKSFIGIYGANRDEKWFIKATIYLKIKNKKNLFH